MIKEVRSRNIRCFSLYLVFGLLGLLQMQRENLVLISVPASLSEDLISYSQQSIPRTASRDKSGTVARAMQLKRNDKPTFIFYVGLPKTATSFLQCTLCANANKTEPILLLDNYEYVGTCPYNTCGLSVQPPQFLRHRFQAYFQNPFQANEAMGVKLHVKGERSDPYAARPTVLSSEFMDYVNAAYERGHNGLMIYEGAASFPDSHIAVMSDYLNQKWHVQIVTGYRPLYEWLPSKYNSVFKHNVVGFWPGEAGGPTEVRPFDIEDRNKYSEMFNDFETVYHMHPTEILRNNYQLYFSNVKIMGQPPLAMATGQGDPILEDFFCHVIPNTPQVCREVMAGSLEFAKGTNPSVSLDEDILAVAAYRAGLLLHVDAPMRNHRRVARDAITEHFENLKSSNGYTFPLECWPPEKLDRLEQLSWDLERQLFDASLKTEQEETHKQGFAETVAKKKFCHIDVNATLAQPEWQSFFASAFPTELGQSRD